MEYHGAAAQRRAVRCLGCVALRSVGSFPFERGFNLWSPYVIGRPYIFLPCSFFPSSFFSSPNLSGRRSDVYHTSTHGVALVRI